MHGCTDARMHGCTDARMDSKIVFMFTLKICTDIFGRNYGIVAHDRMDMSCCRLTPLLCGMVAQQ